MGLSGGFIAEEKMEGGNAEVVFFDQFLLRKHQYLTSVWRKEREREILKNVARY